MKQNKKIMNLNRVSLREFIVSKQNIPFCCKAKRTKKSVFPIKIDQSANHQVKTRNGARALVPSSLLLSCLFLLLLPFSSSQ